MKENDLEKLFKKEKPEPEKLTREEFVIRLMGAGDFWSQRALEVQLGMRAVQELANRVNQAEAMNLKVDFFVEEETGRLSIEVQEKGQMGFKTPKPPLE